MSPPPKANPSIDNLLPASHSLQFPVLHIISMGDAHGMHGMMA